MSRRFTEAEQREIRAKMRVPFFAFVALMGFLACIVLLGPSCPDAPRPTSKQG